MSVMRNLTRYDLKGIARRIFRTVWIARRGIWRRTESTELFLESATVTLGGKIPLGEFGQLLPTLAKKYDLRDAVFLAELNLDLARRGRNSAKSFKPLPQFPSIRRDVAMLVPEADARIRFANREADQARESGKRGIIRRVPRQRNS